MRRALGVAAAAALVAAGWIAWRSSLSLVGARPAANLLLVTIDTLRPDRVGVYGLAGARTGSIDGLAREGTRFDRAWAPAPITLPSHASLLTGLYPPSHGARHNGMALPSSVPTLATLLAAQGFETAAFVAAFPLSRRFGLARGFDVYDDNLGRTADGRSRDERPGALVVDAATAWLARPRRGRFFAWVHLFEPHAPYGTPASGGSGTRSALDRYDDDVAEADRQVGRLLAAVQPHADQTIVVLAADHGEAFGEHGEIAHSIFVYDTTLRVPFIVRGPGVVPGGVVSSSVSLVDLAPTVLRRLGLAAANVEGIDLSSALEGQDLPPRTLIYAESFAPLLDFGWAPLRSVRKDRWKYIAAPTPELYDLESDRQELRNLAEVERDIAQDLERLTATMSRGEIGAPQAATPDPEVIRRLGALGYLRGAASADGKRLDPKDRRKQAARLAQVTSGELSGDALLSTLRDIVRDEPRNPQAGLRLGFALLERKDCANAVKLFDVAIQSGLPSADPYLGRASCEMARGDLPAARATLDRAAGVEPGSVVVLANLGVVESAAGRQDEAVRWFRQALAADPDFHEARFNLALAHARGGDRARALAEATDLLRRLPPAAPQRAEVARLVSGLADAARK